MACWPRRIAVTRRITTPPASNFTATRPVIPPMKQGMSSTHPSEVPPGYQLNLEHQCGRDPPRWDFPQRHHTQLAVDVPGRMESRGEPGHVYMHNVESFSEIRANHQETITATDFPPISQGLLCGGGRGVVVTVKEMHQTTRPHMSLSSRALRTTSNARPVGPTVQWPQERVWWGVGLAD